MRRGRDETWDVILLDVMLPYRDGYDVCRQLRNARVKTPIIMLTARTHEAEKILGLEVGADDYVTKPFSANELRARVKAVRRRFEEEPDGRLAVAGGLGELGRELTPRPAEVGVRLAHGSERPPRQRRLLGGQEPGQHRVPRERVAEPEAIVVDHHELRRHRGP